MRCHIAPLAAANDRRGSPDPAAMVRRKVRSKAVLAAAVCLAAVAGVFRAAAAQGLSQGLSESSSTATPQYCQVVEADQANLPPLEQGVIRDIDVVEGQTIEKGKLLVQLDDSKVLQEAKVAEAKYNAAKTKAGDDVQIRYAKAAKKVADATYEISKKANETIAKSVPEEKLYELDLKRTEAGLQIDKATLDQKVAAEEANVALAEWEAAKVTVERHKLVSPISGVVAKIINHKGEAVQPSAPIIRVVNLETLWVEGSMQSSQFARGELDGQEAAVEVITTRNQKESFAAKIIFVSPETDAGGVYLVRAEIKNRKDRDNHWLIYPKMTATMSIRARTIP